MTTDTTPMAPTDAEIDAVLCNHWPAFSMQATLVRALVRAAMRDALAKWGTLRAEKIVIPTDTMEQEFQKHYQRGYAAGQKASATQPTQSHAGAVPLTCEWTHNEDDGFWETACGEAWRFDDGGPGENNMHFCHSCGNSLRIKGGQHG